jgi:quercetin dioxygenase-like cupin family protein
MIKAYKLYTGEDGHSHFTEGTVTYKDLKEANSILFKETAPHASYDWHPAPTTQYVITLSGTLLFETFLGEQFTLKPGDVLIAMDTHGSGHKWQLIDDQPWKRVYVAFNEDTAINFLPDAE